MAIGPAIRFNWLPRPSLYAEAQAWTARQQALRQKEEYIAAASDSFAAAAQDQTTGMANLAAQVALDRVQSAAQTKVNQVLNTPADTTSDSNTADSSSGITLPDGTVINDDPSIYLDGGSKVNLSDGTLTLPDGTVIDTATGLKKIDLIA
jgi:hypothetical protein